MWRKMLLVRRLNLSVIICLFLIVSYTLYCLIDASTNQRLESVIKEKAQNSINEIERKLDILESEARRNDDVLSAIQKSLYDKFKNPPLRTPRPVHSLPILWDQKAVSLAQSVGAEPSGARRRTHAVCKDFTASRGKRLEDVQMLDVYDKLPFDNPLGGVWKQGWPITYDKEQVENRLPILEVYVVPHSHTDPGWIKTFERYYAESTSHILSSALTMLSDNVDAKFIYAEMSFFSLWWHSLPDESQQEVLRLLKNGQLEIVTGAWVQTDEANSHYFSMIDQLIEGHQWLRHHLGYTPKNHWSIDPFGLSPTMAHLVKLSGIENLVIQRVHYEIKKYLARNKSLEFYWRQLWNDNAEQDAFTHLLPFYSYDIPHTCGPDPKICCQFDFMRTPGSSFGCPWGVPAVQITATNVAERAELLLDQYRKHAQLYKNNVLLVPLGDDFRYQSVDEWHAQYNNYKMLFDYMNQRKDWNVRAQFGTLADYFAALRNRNSSLAECYPVLTGDFFTYADRDHDYWSGYYTSRPFYKRMERILAHYVRGAEIFYSLVISRTNNETLKYASYPQSKFFESLTDARRSLALFQHHDGITGTSKTFVMKDYGALMVNSIDKCKAIIATSVLFSMSNAPPLAQDMQKLKMSFSDVMLTANSAFEHVVISILPAGLRTMVLYNSLPYGRSEVVCIRTNTANLKIYDMNSREVEIQIGPLVVTNPEGLGVSLTVFEVCWLAEVESLGLVTYEMKGTETTDEKRLSTVHGPPSVNSVAGMFPSKGWPKTDFEVSGSSYSALFSRDTGLLKALSPINGRPVRMEVEFVAYATTDRKFTSGGAYLFLPTQEATPLPASELMVYVDGSMYSCVHVAYKRLLHRMCVAKRSASSGQSIFVANTVDLTDEEEDYELVMRLSTDIQNKDGEFFTDLNGLQWIKRRHFDKLPLQANFYPMPSGAYVEDGHNRLTVVSGQPGAVASLDIGQLEFVLDRRTHMDDNRGVEQAVLDNIIFTDRFSLILEQSVNSGSDRNGQRMGSLSMVAYHQSLALLYPLFHLYGTDDVDLDLRGSVRLTDVEFPCDHHLVNLRSVEKSHEAQSAGSRPQSLMVLHRSPLACRFAAPSLMRCDGRGRLTGKALFGKYVRRIAQTSLTMIHDKGYVNLTEPFDLEIMDVKSYRVFWS